MFSRAVRPLMRTQPMASTIRSATFRTQAGRFARPSVAAMVSKTQSRTVAQQQKAAAPAALVQKKQPTQVMMSAMPQLIPFYFVNEVVFGYAALVTLIYLTTKYWLPQTVRARLARLFVSKL